MIWHILGIPVHTQTVFDIFIHLLFKMAQKEFQLLVKMSRYHPLHIIICQDNGAERILLSCFSTLEKVKIVLLTVICWFMIGEFDPLKCKKLTIVDIHTPHSFCHKVCALVSITSTICSLSSWCLCSLLQASNSQVMMKNMIILRRRQ
jgi:hypothetical protein